MEYLEGGTLDQAVKTHNFSEKQIGYVAKEVSTQCVTNILSVCSDTART